MYRRNFKALKVFFRSFAPGPVVGRSVCTVIAADATVDGSAADHAQRRLAHREPSFHHSRGRLAGGDSCARPIQDMAMRGRAAAGPHAGPAHVPLLLLAIPS